MIEKRISLKIETGDAKRQLDAIKTSLSGIDKNMPDGKSDPFKTTTTSTKTARKALIDYTGTLSNSNRIVIQSSNYATLAEKASLAQDTALRKLNKAYDEGHIDVTAYNAAISATKSRYAESVSQLNAVTTATGKGAAGFKVMRGGLSQMSYQLQDIAVQAQMGTSWFTIIGQQGPQIASIFGPLGAVLGVVVALGAAFGGVLFKSLGVTIDATKELDETLKSLESTFKKTKDGAYVLSDSFYALRDSSKAVSDLQLKIAKINTQKGLDELSKKVKQDANAISTSFFGMVNDIDVNQYQKSMKMISGATEEELNKAKVFIIASVSQGSKRLRDLGESMRVVADTQESLASKFSISTDQSKKLLNAINTASLEKSKKSFDDLAIAVSSVGDNIKDEKVRKSFLDYANKVVEVAVNMDLLSKKSQELVKGPFSGIKQTVSGQTSSFAALSASYKDISSIIVNLSSEQDKLNKYGKENKVSISSLNDIMKEYTTKTLSDSIKNQDGYNKKLKLYNEITASGINLTKDQVSTLKQLIGVPDSIANGYMEYADARVAANNADKDSYISKLINGYKELGQALKTAYSGDYFSSSQIAVARLNSGLDKYSSLIVKIANQQSSMKKIDISSTGMSDANFQLVQRKSMLKTIADETAKLDTNAKRQKLINDLKTSGLDLTKEEVKSINDQANKQNYVYEKQINFLSQIGDIISQSTEKTITAANETKTWGELASQLSEVYDQGAKDYAKSVGTYNTSLQSLVTSTFKSMEDAIVSWAETGKLKFTDFVNSAISDLLRLIVQQQLAGIATAFVGGSSAGGESYLNTSTSATGTFSKGGAIERFATGGITGMVNTVQSTPKRFANGSGMLGEAGQAEAIVPLTRTSGGDLGIKSVGGSSQPVINFNVTNEAGVESTSTQSQNANGSIDINIINSLVSKSIASGYADKAITSRFDTKKRGK